MKETIKTITGLPSSPRTLQPHRRCTPIIIHRMSYMWTFLPLDTQVHDMVWQNGGEAASNTTHFQSLRNTDVQ